MIRQSLVFCASKNAHKWKEAGTFVPARMKKKNICIESFLPSMLNTIPDNYEENVTHI